MAIKVRMTEGGSRVDEGEYKAIIVGLEEGEHPQHGYNFKWKFKLKDPVFEGDDLDEDTFITCITGQKLTSHPKNKLNQLLLALGKDIAKGDEVDLEEMVGKPLRLIVKDNEKEEGTFSKVVQFMKVRKKKNPQVDDDSDEDTSSKPAAKEKADEKKKESKKEDDASGDDLFAFDDDD